MVMVTWEQAHAYVRWRAEVGQQPWRMPMEREWQRAARGADRRLYPWGDRFEPTWCRNVLSEGPTSIVPAGAYPVDVSVFGVRGLAGNVSEWVADPLSFDEQAASTRVLWAHDPAAAQHLACGGSCAAGPLSCSTSYRGRLSAAFRAARLGFRPSRRWGETTATGGRPSP